MIDARASDKTVPLWQLVSIHLVVYIGMVIVFQPSPWWAAAVFVLPLMWASVTDVMRFEIPDLAALGIAVSGVIWLLAMQDAAFGANVGTALILGCVFYGIGEAYYRRTGVDGLGMGDAKLVAGLGLWTGPYGAVLMILIASLSALACLIMMARSKSSPQGIAFGPFLCLSAWAVWLAKGS